MTDGAREYLEGVQDCLHQIEDDYTRTMFNEFYRICSQLLVRVEELEGKLQELQILEIVLAPDQLDS